MKQITQLDLTPEEAQGVRKYREWVSKSRSQGRLRRYLVQIDAEFPGLDDEYRFELADNLFRAHMSKVKREAHADLVRRAKQAGGQ